MITSVRVHNEVQIYGYYNNRIFLNIENKIFQFNIMKLIHYIDVLKFLAVE